MGVFKLTSAAGSNGITLPKKMLERLHINEGDAVLS
jgi:antitoxin component of MazEF toxin-antitoxin module